MALDASLRETILRLTPEEKAEVRHLVAPVKPTTSEALERWIEEADRLQAEYEREGVRVDTIAEVRAVRDES